MLALPAPAATHLRPPVAPLPDIKTVPFSPRFS